MRRRDDRLISRSAIVAIEVAMRPARRDGNSRRRRAAVESGAGPDVALRTEDQHSGDRERVESSHPRELSIRPADERRRARACNRPSSRPRRWLRVPLTATPSISRNEIQKSRRTMSLGDAMIATGDCPRFKVPAM